MAIPPVPSYSRAMKTLRPWLSAVVGLALLVQGLAFASAPFGTASGAPVAAAAVAAMDEMPCHGDAQPDTVDAAAACACCDDGCADMGGCAYGQLAAGPSIGAQFPAAPQDVVVAVARATTRVSLPLPLRPPISFHA